MDSSRRQSQRPTRNSSLLSIPESDESTASPHRPPTTPLQSDLNLSRRSLRSTGKVSLLSIPELDESIQSPSPRKRRPSYSLTPCQPAVKRTRKSVTFGPALSPEVFDKWLPPSTPVKTGLTPKGLRRSATTGAAAAAAMSTVPEESDHDDSYEYSMTGFEVSIAPCGS